MKRDYLREQREKMTSREATDTTLCHVAVDFMNWVAQSDKSNPVVMEFYKKHNRIPVDRELFYVFIEEKNKENE